MSDTTTTTTTTAPAAAEQPAKQPEPAKPQRKGPGRPRKTIETQAVEIRGIVKEPEDPDNYLEFVYCNTSLFTDLMKMFGLYNVSDIEISFGRENIEINATSPSGKIKQHVSIDARGINHYYCREPFKSCISTSILNDVLFGGSKNYHKITMIAQSDYRSKLKIVLNNLEYNVDEIFDLAVGCRLPDPNAVPEVAPTNADYPVKFTMSKQYFNTSMVKLRKFGKDALFQKIGGGGFQIRAINANRTAKTDSFRDNKNIMMECSLPEGDILSVTVSLDYLIPFAKANISNQIVVSLSKTKNICLMANIAPAANIGPICCIKVYADINGI